MAVEALSLRPRVGPIPDPASARGALAGGGSGNLPPPRRVVVAHPTGQGMMKPIRLAIFCVAALAAAAAHGTVDRIRKPAPAPPPAGARPASASAGSGAPAPARKNPAHRDSTLTAAEIHQLIEEGALMVVDARPADQFAQGHMPSAFHLPFEAFRRGRPAVLDFLQPEERILIYCGGGDCEASHHVQEMLYEFGYTNTEVYLPGWPGWLEYGGPVETGAAP